MGDTNNTFSSLDPLGPEYGRINQPVVDAKGLSAFEGENLKAPLNDLSQQSFFPTLPNVENLTSPQKNVRDQLIQYAPNKPGPNKKNFDFKSFAQALKNDSKAKLTVNDKNSYAKIYSYNAGPDGNAFYKKYAAYGPELFSKIGFSPLRDNESLYNEHTTWWDDHKKMMLNSFWPLFGKGLVSGPKSLIKMLHGDFTSSDSVDAAEYAEYAAIGQSSKKGFGSFMNNTIMNFGYSAGIMTEAILEEVAGLLLAPETGGASAVVSTANLIKNTGRAIRGLDKAVDGYKAVNATLNSVKSVSGARNFWKNANTIGTSAFSPISNTLTSFKAAKAADNLTNLGKGFKTFGGFYRDVQRINMALSEARLEGGMVKNEVYDQLYNEHYAKFKEAPTDAQQYEMIKQSEKASLNTVLWNTALIYGSNAIVFPNIMGAKGGIRNSMKNTIKELKTIKGGKFGDFGEIIYDNTKKSFDFRAASFKNMAKSWLKQPIYKSTLGTIGYFKANFSEGIQENLQEVIAGANKRYYIDTFNSKALQAHSYGKGAALYNEASQAAYFSEELGKQFTATGFETFASGFAMGALAMPLNSAFKNLGIGYNRMFNKEVYEDFKKTKLDITKNMVNNLNSIDIKDFLNSNYFNYGVQDEVSNIKKEGSVKEATDATFEGLVYQMNTLLENGTLDVFRKNLNDMGQLTPEELEDAIPTIPKGEGEKYLAKIPKTIEKIKKIEKTNDYYQEKFPNPVDLRNLPEKDSPEYRSKVALYYGWNNAIKNAVFFNEAYTNTVERKKSIMEKYLSQAPLKNMSQRDSEVIFDYTKLKNEEAMLKDEIISLELLTDPESVKQYKFKKRKLEALTQLGVKTADLNNFFNRYERVAELRKILQKEKGDVPVTDEEIEKLLNDNHGEFTDENKIKKYSEHEASYKEYLRALASLDGDYIFDKDVDDSYELLADHYKLDSESRNLMNYVNLIHDPNAFIESAVRNSEWMQELYAKRGSIYEKMITEHLSVVIDNALLNSLANKSIYISMEDFQAWQENGTPPSEFFDHAGKMIIPEGTPEYDVYYEEFEKAAELKDQKTTTVPESLDAQLKKDLEDADKAMQIELENLPKKEVRTLIKKIIPNATGKITLTKINSELESDQYADGEYGGDTPFVLFKDTENQLKLDDINGEVIENMSALAIIFDSVEVYTLSEQADPVLAEAIKQKYIDFKNKISEDYANYKEKLIKEESTVVKDFVPIIGDEDSLSEYPALHNKLFTSFQEIVISKLSDEENQNLTDEQVSNLFNNFLKTNKDARIEIDNFNKAKKLETVTQETGEKGEFEYMYQGKKVNTESIKTVKDLRAAQRRIKALVVSIEAKEDITPEDKTDKSKYKIIITDLEKLIATRSRKGLTPELIIASDKLKTLKETQGEITITSEGITINNELYKTIEELTGVAEENSIFKQYIDEQVKNLFSVESGPEFNPARITQEAFDNLFGPKGYVTAIKQRVDNGELVIISEDFIIFDEKTKIASKVGLVIADTKGNLTIVDVIADSKTNWDVFKKKDNPKSKLKKTSLLLLTKANLLSNMLGVSVNAAVLPIEIIVTGTDSKIVSANKPSSPTILATDFLVSLDKKGVQAEADAFVPVVEKEVLMNTEAKANIVPVDAESSDDTESPAIKAEQEERKVEVIDDSLRYRVSDFKADLAKVNSQEELQVVITELSIKIPEGIIAQEDLQEMAILAKQKKEELANPQTVKIVPETLTVGTKLIAKNIIFTEDGNNKSEVFANANDTLVMQSINLVDKTVTVAVQGMDLILGTANEIVFSFKDLNKIFTLNNVVMSAIETKESLSTEDKQKIETSIDLTDSFIKDTAQLDKIENAVSTKALKDLDDELLDDIEC